MRRTEERVASSSIKNPGVQSATIGVAGDRVVFTLNTTLFPFAGIRQKWSGTRYLCEGRGFSPRVCYNDPVIKWIGFISLATIIVLASIFVF